MKRSPLAQVKEQFGSKDKLVSALIDLVERGDEEKNELRQRLSVAPNTKLLRLHQIAQEVGKQGGKEKLVEQILQAQGRSRDDGYGKKLNQETLGRVAGLYRSAALAKTQQARTAAPKATRKKQRPE